MSKQIRDELLMTRLLAAVDRFGVENASQAHPDEETLALFTAGELTGDERESLVEHFDRCAICRQTAGALLMLPGDEPAAVETARGFWFTPANLTWFALAASLLLAVGLVWGMKGPRSNESEAYRQVAMLVVDGKFDEAAGAVARAERNGVASDRLKSLRSQATRRIPDPIALSYAGRLADFGYEPGGIAARGSDNAALGEGAKPALEQLKQAGTADVEVLLNRGHALLTLGRAQEGLAEFDAAVRLAPKNALAWLGRGLAEFMLDRFETAADDFRKSLELDPRSVPAKMNLAMSLDESVKREEALTMWRSLREIPLSEKDRRFVERAIEEMAHE